MWFQSLMYWVQFCGNLIGICAADKQQFQFRRFPAASAHSVGALKCMTMKDKFKAHMCKLVCPQPS